MADHSITITNTLVVQGGGEPSLWGSMQWGVDNWGNTNDMEMAVTKCLSNVLNVLGETESTLTKVIALTINVSDTSQPVALQDGGVYNYILTGGVTDPSQRPSTSYSEDSDAGTSYSEVSASSTTWSAA